MAKRKWQFKGTFTPSTACLVTRSCFTDWRCQSCYWPRFQGPNTHTKRPSGMTILIWCVCLAVISCDGHGPNSWQASASMWRWVISNEGELLPFQEAALIAGFWLNTMIVIGSVPMICFRKTQSFLLDEHKHERGVYINRSNIKSIFKENQLAPNDPRCFVFSPSPFGVMPLLSEGLTAQ